MGDTNNTGAEVEKDLDAETGAEDLEETQTDGDTDPEAEGADKSDESGDKKPDEADKAKAESKPTPPADEEPKTRKRNVDFIIERKNRKIEKLQNKDNIEDEDNLDPSDEEIIQKQVAKVLSPFLAKQMQDEDSQEIGDFITQNPDFAPYADKVKRFAQHPSRKDMPIQSIFYEVAGQDLLKIGADRAKKADLEAKKSRAGGGSATGVDSEKSVWDLTPEEFTAKQDEIRNKSR